MTDSDSSIVPVKRRNGLRKDLREIYESRNILRSLVSKNLFGRYKNSVLGFGWHFVMPIIMLVVYYVVFTEVRASPISDFWVYIAAGIFPFNFMVSNLTGGAGAIVGNSGMVKKMYFPREILVLAHVISNFIVMVMGYAVILIIIAVTGYPLDWVPLLLLPAILLLMALFTTGYTLLFSSLTVYARDVQYILSSVSMIFFFMTPMYFLADSVSGMLGNIIWLNPFTYYIEAFHSMVYFGEIPEMKVLLMCIILPLVSMMLGLAVFRRLKRGFAERL